MVKPTTIKSFNDSLFLLQVRGGMLYSKGTWKASADGKHILLKSFKHTKVFGWDTAAYFVVTKPRIELVKNKLVYNEIVLTDEH